MVLNLLTCVALSALCTAPLTSAKATDPFFGYIPPTPALGTTFTVAVGQTLEFDIVVEESDPFGAIGFVMFTMPVGATLDPASPVVIFGDGINPTILSTTFSWTPTAAQVGSHFANFDAANLTGGRLPGMYFFEVVEDLGHYSTYTQGGWGAKPAGNNPGKLLAKNFATVFPNGIEIGIPGATGKSLKFTSAYAIEKFLPSGGTPGVLTGDAVNPVGSTGGGSFAGQVLALAISTGFSAAGVTQGGLGDLILFNTGNSNLNGQTVSQVLAAANTALGGGGLPFGMTCISTLNDLITNLNEGFDNGVTNGWAKAHLHE